jgi:CheY-like chemotaxis protein
MPKTLLLADDSVTIQKVVGISFANEDVRLITVDNGDAAIARAREERPDVILADVVMPGKSGYEVCEAVKADPGLRHVPVLLLTGSFEAFDEARATRVGAAGHISKPFESQQLVEQVKRLLAQSEAERRAAARAPAPPPPAPAPSPAPAHDDSFEFFNDEIGEPAAAVGAEPSDAFVLDENDSAFAFGDAEVGSLDADLPQPLARKPATAERTVAILPEPRPAAPRSVPIGRMEKPAVAASDADTGVGLPPLDAPATAADDAFEFEFDSSPASSRDGSLRVDSDDLAQATVLDPNGASGFDVSSSDLSDVFAPPAPAAKAPAPGRAPAAAPAEPVVAPEDSFSGFAIGAAEEAEFAPLAAAEVDELDEASLEELEPLRPPEPARRPAAAPAPPSAAAAALEALAPQLRAQLHDTLEKIAWESFSTVTEQIVRLALERVETIAWEVIPQMAETLVREEIRRMKGETE